MPQTITKPARVLLVDNGELIGQVQELINNKQPVKIRVKGNSMFPFLRHERDVVTLKYPLPEELTPGSIVMFHYMGRQILHRIVRKKDNLYYIRGDNNRNNVFEYATYEDIVGVVTTLQRNGKSISSDNKWWKFFSFLWIQTHHLRLFFYKGKRFAGQILRKLKLRR